MNRLCWLPALFSVLLLLAAGCGSARRFGDPEGTPVTMSVRVEKPFFDNMSRHTWQPSAGAGIGFTPGGGRGLGLGLGLGFTTTSVYLIGGSAPGQADAFRKEIKWGENTFEVPLRPGRLLVVGVQAEGGRSGWESLGQVTIPASGHSRVRVVMDADGGKVMLAEDTPAKTAPNP